MSKTSKSPSLGGRQKVKSVAKLTDFKRTKKSVTTPKNEKEKPGLDEGLILC